MSALPVIANLVEVADEINAQYKLATSKAVEAVAHARRAGDLLIAAKQQVGHGDWLTWMQENITFSERTAQLYMRVAANWGAIEAKSATVADLTLRQVVAALPKREKPAISENTEKPVTRQKLNLPTVPKNETPAQRAARRTNEGVRPDPNPEVFNTPESPKLILDWMVDHLFGDADYWNRLDVKLLASYCTPEQLQVACGRLDELMMLVTEIRGALATPHDHESARQLASYATRAHKALLAHDTDKYQQYKTSALAAFKALAERSNLSHITGMTADELIAEIKKL